MIDIYKATSPSGKVYIGISGRFIKRKNEHINSAFNKNSTEYNSTFKKAIRKYGIDKIQWTIIDTALDFSSANELERRYILHFNSYYRGYNMTLGGSGGSMYTYSKEEIITATLQCNTFTEMSNKFKVLYEKLNEYKVIDIDFYKKCTTHFITHYTDWNEETLLEISNEYRTVKEFKENNSAAWKAAHRCGKIFYKKCTSHMVLIQPTPKWSKEVVLKEAKKYATKAQMRNQSNNAYQAMRNFKKKDLDFFNRCVSHMVNGYLHKHK